ncbi:hypothetical protein, partial [Enterococcus faecalis]|uniref:hypothetical protein n=1 Tax=Enterococcus faecalis TaxID=1351 RepID=UPI00403F8357
MDLQVVSARCQVQAQVSREIPQRIRPRGLTALTMQATPPSLRSGTLSSRALLPTRPITPPLLRRILAPGSRRTWRAIRF